MPSPAPSWGGSLELCEMLFSQDLKDKDIPINLPSDAMTPRKGTECVSRTHKDLFCSQGYLPTQPPRLCQDRRERAEPGQLLLHLLADAPFSIISNLGKMPPSWGHPFVSRGKEAGRGACAGEGSRWNCLRLPPEKRAGEVSNSLPPQLANLRHT